jgi:hypothetical protein
MKQMAAIRAKPAALVQRTDAVTATVSGIVLAARATLAAKATLANPAFCHTAETRGISRSRRVIRCLWPDVPELAI